MREGEERSTGSHGSHPWCPEWFKTMGVSITRSSRSKREVWVVIGLQGMCEKADREEGETNSPGLQDTMIKSNSSHLAPSKSQDILLQIYLFTSTSKPPTSRPLAQAQMTVMSIEMFRCSQWQPTMESEAQGGILRTSRHKAFFNWNLIVERTLVNLLLRSSE